MVGDVTSYRLVLSVRIRRYHSFWESKNGWESQCDSIGGRPASVCRRRRGISESDHPAGLHRLADPSLHRLPLGNRQLSRRGAPHHVYQARDNGRSPSGMVTLGQCILDVLTADIASNNSSPQRACMFSRTGLNDDRTTMRAGRWEKFPVLDNTNLPTGTYTTGVNSIRIGLVR